MIMTPPEASTATPPMMMRPVHAQIHAMDRTVVFRADIMLANTHTTIATAYEYQGLSISLRSPGMGRPSLSDMFYGL